MRKDWRLLLGRKDTRPLIVQYGHAEKLRRVSAFPAKYSMLDDGYVPEVREQQTSNCWIYGAICAMETYLRKHNLVAAGDPLYADLSEMHMTYDMFDLDPKSSSNANPQGMLPKIDPRTLEEEYGGDETCSCAYLTRGRGCVSEAVDPAFQTLPGNIPRRRYAVTDGKERRFLVSGFRYIENSIGSLPDWDFILDVKDAVLSDSAVSVGIAYDDVFMKVDTSVKPYQRSFYCNNSTYALNHTVCVIGWDDSYAKSNFVVSPPTDGAFLIRNSWGIQKNSSGTVIDDGYFWLSYADMKIADAYCITGVRKDFYEEAFLCYRHNIFSMMPSTEELGNDQKIEFSARYDSAQTGATLTDVGICCLTPCLATITCTTGGTTTTVAAGQKLAYAGYHTVHLSTPLQLLAGDWTVKVTYEAIRHIRVFAPVEYQDSEYANIVLKSGQSFIDGEDVVDINARKGESYGNVILHAYVHLTAAGAVSLEKALKNVQTKLPASQDGRVDGLPTTVDSVAVDWNIEPQKITEYMPSYNCVIGEYTVGSARKGLINLTSSVAAGYVCAALGTGAPILRKNIPVTLDSKGAYTFVAPKATENLNTNTLSGTFPVDGATVTASARGKTRTTTVKNGKWEIKDFQLFPVNIKKKEGWDEAYKKTIVSVSISVDQNVVLASGSMIAESDCPYTFEKGEYIVYSWVGFICALLAIGGAIAIIKLKKSMPADSSELQGLLSNVSLVSGLGTDGRVSISGIQNNCFIGQLYSVENIDFIMESNGAPNGPAGCIAQKISKGGHITNCSVSGTLVPGSDLGGLFYEGEDVTVSGCDVKLNASSLTGTFAGVGVKLSGDCKISSVTVSGSCKADKVCGIAGQMEGGSITMCAAELQVTGTSLTAGIVGEAKNATVSSCCVNGEFTAEGVSGVAAGVAGSLSGSSSVINSRVSALLKGGTVAAGIAGKMFDTAVVSCCYVACRLSGGVSYGIAEGISGRTSIKQCASLCSHLEGSKAARISPNASEGCIAYQDMTCDAGVSFSDSGVTLKKPDELLLKSTYQALGWNFDLLWIMHPKDSFPYLLSNRAQQTYDYPFPCAYAPAQGFTFMVEQLICFYGNSHPRASAPTWSLSPADKSQVVYSGESLCKNGSFYLKIGTMAIPGDYDLKVISPLDGHKYTFPIAVKITEIK